MAVDLIYHSTYGQNRKIRKCLRDGVHVDALNFREENSLLHAARHGQVETVKLLLNEGSEPNRINIDGISPLLASAMSNKNKCASLLLQSGAVWNLQKMKNNDVIKFTSQNEEKEDLVEEFKIEANEISVLSDSRSIDVFHMFRMKDCLVKGQHCVAKIQLRHSFHHHHVAVEQDDDWLLREFETLRFLTVNFDLIHYRQSLAIFHSLRLPEKIKTLSSYNCYNEVCFHHRSLRHPHIIQPYFFSISNEKKYNILITEPISGGTLYHVMYDLKQTVSTKVCKKIIEEILLAMIFLNSKHIVHNFLNSTSVYITKDWRIKLGNFEYSYYEGEQRHTRSSVPVEEFHFPYLAPELIRDSELFGNESSDVYSFGCLTWELLGRKRPWCWLERTDIISLAQISHPITLPMPPCWPRALRDTILHATKLLPKERMNFKNLYSDVFLPSTTARSLPNVIITADSTEMKNKRNSGSHVQFCPETESKYIGIPGVDFNEYVVGTHTGIQNNVSTASVDGRIRKGCLKMSSRSDAVIKRALPSTIITHNYSGCLCAEHSRKKIDFKESNLVVENVESTKSSLNNNSTSSRETYRECTVNEKPEKNTVQKINSDIGVSKEEIVDIQTIRSTMSNQKQDFGKTFSPAMKVLDVVSNHQRTKWSRLASTLSSSSKMKKKSDKSLKSSFVRDFLAMNMPSMESHRFGPHTLEHSVSEVAISSYATDAIEKEAVLQEIFRTAGKYEKKNWAKATILDRDLLGNRCYKSKSWCNIYTD